jgi:hypothetical protein
VALAPLGSCSLGGGLPQSLALAIVGTTSAAAAKIIVDSNFILVSLSGANGVGPYPKLS